MAFEEWLTRTLMLAAVPRPTADSFMMRMLESAYVERLSPETAAGRIRTVLRGPAP